MCALERLQEKTFGAVAGLQAWSIFATLENLSGGIHTQIALLLGGAMTAVAVLCKDGFDLASVIDRGGEGYCPGDENWSE